MSYAEHSGHVHYVTARHGSRTALLVGPFRTHPPMRRRAAVSAAYFVLLDNGASGAKGARDVAAVLEESPDGERVSGFGYSFRIVEVNR